MIRNQGKTTRKVQFGDTVQVCYTGMIENGTVCLASPETCPLQFTVGQGRIIAGVESAVVGMQVGDLRKVTVAPQDGFGDVCDGLLITVDKEQVQNNLEIEIGQRLCTTSASGKKIMVTVVEVSRRKAILDTTHPLAGKTITFKIRLMEIL